MRKSKAKKSHERMGNMGKIVNDGLKEEEASEEEPSEEEQDKEVMKGMGTWVGL